MGVTILISYYCCNILIIIIINNDREVNNTILSEEYQFWPAEPFPPCLKLFLKKIFISNRIKYLLRFNLFLTISKFHNFDFILEKKKKKQAFDFF